MLLLAAVPDAHARLQSGEIHVWETQEIILESSRAYPNPYRDVDCWIELAGPGFKRRVYGFWDGGTDISGAVRRHIARKMDVARRVEPSR